MTLSFGFADAIPKDLLPIIQDSFDKAAWAWVESRVVFFAKNLDGAVPSNNINITAARTATGQIPPVFYRGNWPHQELVVNLNVPWRRRWWQFWRPVLGPELMAHGIGHICGLHRDGTHSIMRNSVMYEWPTAMPNEHDLAGFRVALGRMIKKNERKS